MRRRKGIDNWRIRFEGFKDTREGNIIYSFVKDETDGNASGSSAPGRNEYSQPFIRSSFFQNMRGASTGRGGSRVEFEHNSNSRGSGRGEFEHNSRSRGSGRGEGGQDSRRTETFSHNLFNNRPKEVMGFRYLENLLEQDPENLCSRLFADLKPFLKLLQSTLTVDFGVIIIKILRKICESPFQCTKHKLLLVAFDEKFVDNLEIFIESLQLQEARQRDNSEYFWRAPEEVWKNLLEVFEYLVENIPMFAWRFLPNLLNSLKIGLPVFESEHNINSSEIKNRFEKLLVTVKHLLEESELKKIIEESDLTQEKQPNLREISVYPSASEIRGKRNLLQPNVVQGPFQSVNHYLDVHFRLLREDFVAFLRTNVVNYLNGSADDTYENVKFHRNVQFLHAEARFEYWCFRVKFNSSKWKEMKYGPLLCFTRDNFETIIFGKAIHTVDEIPKIGEFVVAFENEPTLLLKTNYLMAEIKIYCENYHPVLKALQQMQEVNFPMEKYLIRVDSLVEPAKFIPASSMPIFRSMTSSLDLNESQEIAFKAAITQEFTLIQGPPGTGKTVLGLEIAKKLLSVARLWHKRSPMLVICFTNSALDHFLEGLLTYTKRIVRVGGQSKNLALQEFNLKNLGSRLPWFSSVSQFHTKLAMYIKELTNIKVTLSRFDKNLSVINFDVFSDIIDEFYDTWFGNASEEEIIRWLFGGREDNLESSIDETRILEGEDERVETSRPHHQPLAEDEVETVKFGNTIISLNSISVRISQLKVEQLWLDQEPPRLSLVVRKGQVQASLKKLMADFEFLQMRLNQRETRSNPNINLKNVNLQRPDEMESEKRWDLYFYWLSLYETKLKNRMLYLNNKYRETYAIYRDLVEINNTNIMKDALVVGMTNSCAARIKTSLESLKSPIVIVDEAEQILEAQIVAALTPHCQQLILIGDHKKLKVKTVDYEITDKYHLGTSMFARMAINKINCYTLNIQYRMRPEISSLIRFTSYPSLIDHESVKDRPPIRGIDNSLFFINHESLMEENLDETRFLIHLAKHLTRNGYEEQNITILTPYFEIETEMQREKDYHQLDYVTVTTLQNYHNKECDIILLSLMRRNETKKYKFLSIENIICLSLSRARNGLFIVGNMKQLCDESEFWQKIKVELENQNAIGSELMLRCQVHPDTITKIKSATDFLTIPEGGCNLKCEKNLSCGHNCTLFCHVLDRNHKKYQCHEICGKKFHHNGEAHVCKRMCFETCGF